MEEKYKCGKEIREIVKMENKNKRTSTIDWVSSGVSGVEREKERERERERKKREREIKLHYITYPYSYHSHTFQC